jgi:hypothetical protein
VLCHVGAILQISAAIALTHAGTLLQTDLRALQSSPEKRLHMWQLRSLYTTPAVCSAVVAFLHLIAVIVPDWWKVHFSAFQAHTHTCTPDTQKPKPCG